VVSVERDGSLLAFRFDPDSPIDPTRVVNLTKQFSDAQLSPVGVLKLTLGETGTDQLLSTVKEVLLELSQA